MSDGPHRSLPLKSHWKSVAERAAKDAWVIQEVADTISYAVQCELREIPHRLLRRILGDNDEPSLFANDTDTVLLDLESARINCRGSAIANAAIDGAIHAVLEGEKGEAAYKSAVGYAVERGFQNHSRSIEEHYQREAGDRSARHMRDRLADAGGRCDFAEVVALHSRSEPQTSKKPKLERRVIIPKNHRVENWTSPAFD